MELEDNNLLDLWLRASRLPTMTVQELVKELDQVRRLVPLHLRPPEGWPVYPVPTQGPYVKSSTLGPRTRETTRD